VKAWTMLALSSAVCLAAACGSDGEDLPKVDCATGAVPTFTALKAGAFTKCVTCHASTVSGPGRVDAPASINFDTYAAAKAEAKEAASEVNGGAMPPKNWPVLTEEEKTAIYRWALCGTPE